MVSAQNNWTITVRYYKRNMWRNVKRGVINLAVGILLNIYPSYASDKITSMLIAPSYSQNPFLRKLGSIN